jgi:lipid-A-disaccharide synthase
MHYYIIAGERSGDLHASNLIKAIKQLDTLAVFKGFGGDYMREAGAQLTVHYRELAFMGFAEVLANINKIRRNINICKEDILSVKPDVIILVDYGGFNTRIAKFARKQGLKVFFYITPKVWAWNQSRALTLKANVDRMFVILPFEKDFYKKYDWEVDYVGNPVLDAVKAHVRDEKFLSRNKFETGKPLVALLPGSRKQELKNVIPVMASVARQFPAVQFGVAAVSNLDQTLYADMQTLTNVKFVQEDTYNLLSHASAAIVTSGTATLETALLKVPQVVIYKTSTISYTIAKSFIKVPFISLVNLIAGKEVVKEMIQQKMEAGLISNELNQILNNKTYRDQILAEYAKIYKTLDIGSASENAAKLMVKYLKS